MNKPVFQRILALSPDIPAAAQHHVAHHNELAFSLASNQNLAPEIWKLLWITASRDPSCMDSEYATPILEHLADRPLTANQRRIVINEPWDRYDYGYVHREVLGLFLNANHLTHDELMLFVGQHIQAYEPQARLIEQYYDDHVFQLAMLAYYSAPQKLRAAQWFSANEFSDADMIELLIDVYAKTLKQDEFLAIPATLRIISERSAIWDARWKLLSRPRSLRGTALASIFGGTREWFETLLATKTDPAIWGQPQRTSSSRHLVPPDIMALTDKIGNDPHTWQMLFEFYSNPAAVKRPLGELITLARSHSSVPV
jgi:hypothetical protein